MSVKVASNRFIIPSLKEYSDLFQQLRGSVSIFQHLGNKLVKETEIAQAFRRTSTVEELGSVLSNLPLRGFRLAGQYFLAWCDYRKGKDVRLEIEKVIEQSDTFRAKAFLTLSVLQEIHGEYELGLQSCQAAISCNPSPSIITQATRGIAILKSREGFNKSALKDLTMISPIVRYADPMNYCQYLNSLAVELGEIGRIEEAQNICRIILASPYAFAYPEWRETWQDLALRGYKSRSSVPIIRTIPVVRKVRENVLYMSEYERSEGHRPSPFDFPRDISTIAGWKEKKMVKEKGKDPNGNDVDVDKMDEQEMVLKLITMLTTGEGDERKIRKLLKEAFKIFYEK